VPTAFNLTGPSELETPGPLSFLAPNKGVGRKDGYWAGGSSVAFEAEGPQAGHSAVARARASQAAMSLVNANLPCRCGRAKTGTGSCLRASARRNASIVGKPSA
jgi:hypothetical protein